MLLNTSILRQDVCRLIARATMLAVFFLAVGLVWGPNAQAAGCFHRFENAGNGLDPFGKPLAHNVQKVYSGGEFKYYVLPLSKPCKGPICRGVPPMNVASVPPVIANNRFDLTFFIDTSIAAQSHYCNHSMFWLAIRPISKVRDGLLRPPTS